MAKGGNVQQARLRSRRRRWQRLLIILVVAAVAVSTDAAGVLGTHSGAVANAATPASPATAVDGPTPSMTAILPTGGSVSVPLPEPVISPNGRVVAVLSDAVTVGSSTVEFNSSRLRIWVVSPKGGAVPVDVTDKLVDQPSDPQLSADGRFVAFVARSVFGDPDRGITVFRADTVTGEVLQVGPVVAGGVIDPAANAINPSVSDDGRYVVYESDPQHTGSGQIYLWDSTTATSRLISQANGTPGRGASSRPAISGDGSAIAFTTVAPDLVPGLVVGAQHGTEAVIWDRSGAISLVSRTTASATSTAAARNSGLGSARSVSTDGRFVAFVSTADAGNFVTGGIKDGNAKTDVFVRDRTTGVTRVASAIPNGKYTCRGESNQAAVSNSGVVIFASTCIDLKAGSTGPAGGGMSGPKPPVQWPSC